MRVLLVFVFALSLGFYLNVDHGKKFATPVQEAKPALTYQQVALREQLRKLRARDALSRAGKSGKWGDNPDAHYHAMKISETSYEPGFSRQVGAIGHGKTVWQDAVDGVDFSDEFYQIKGSLRSRRIRARKVRYTELVERGRVSWLGKDVVPPSVFEVPEPEPEPELPPVAQGGLFSSVSSVRAASGHSGAVSLLSVKDGRIASLLPSSGLHAFQSVPVYGIKAYGIKKTLPSWSVPGQHVPYNYRVSSVPGAPEIATNKLFVAEKSGTRPRGRTETVVDKKSVSHKDTPLHVAVKHEAGQVQVARSSEFRQNRLKQYKRILRKKYRRRPNIRPVRMKKSPRRLKKARMAKRYAALKSRRAEKIAKARQRAFQRIRKRRLLALRERKERKAGNIKVSSLAREKSARAEKRQRRKRGRRARSRQTEVAVLGRERDAIRDGKRKTRKTRKRRTRLVRISRRAAQARAERRHIRSRRAKTRQKRKVKRIRVARRVKKVRSYGKKNYRRRFGFAIDGSLVGFD